MAHDLTDRLNATYRIRENLARSVKGKITVRNFSAMQSDGASVLGFFGVGYVNDKPHTIRIISPEGK